MNGMKKWLLYNARSQLEQGPWTLPEIVKFLLSQGTHPQSISDWFVWTDGLSDWLAAKSHPEIGFHFASKIAAPPRPRAPAPPASSQAKAATETSDVPKLNAQKRDGIEPLILGLFQDSAEAHSLDHHHESLHGELPVLDLHSIDEGIQSDSPPQIVDQASVAKQNRSKPLSAAVDPRERRRHKRFEVDLKVVIMGQDQVFRTRSVDVSLGGLKLKAAIPLNLLGRDCVIYLAKSDESENLEFRARPVAGDGGKIHRLKFDGAPEVVVDVLMNWLEQGPTRRKKIA